jgi:hypothetical protein
MIIKQELLERGLELIHEVLKSKSIPEEIRIKLAEWRTDVEWEIDQIDAS